MATTKIIKITVFPNSGIQYAIKDKTGAIKDSITDGIHYAVNDKTGEVTYFTLTSYQYCVEETAVEVSHKY